MRQDRYFAREQRGPDGLPGGHGEFTCERRSHDAYMEFDSCDGVYGERRLERHPRYERYAEHRRTDRDDHIFTHLCRVRRNEPSSVNDGDRHRTDANCNTHGVTYVDRKRSRLNTHLEFDERNGVHRRRRLERRPRRERHADNRCAHRHDHLFFNLHRFWWHKFAGDSDRDRDRYRCDPGARGHAECNAHHCH